MLAKKSAVAEKPAKKEDDWMTKKWRPMMAMMYMICCLADFFIFPIMFTVVQFWETQIANDAFRQWVPITLQGGGLFHVAMGAVLGVSAYGRTQEKINGAANASTTLPSSGVPTPTLSSAIPGMQPASVNAPATNAWGAQPVGGGGGFGGAPAQYAQPTNTFASAEVGTGWGGKKAPPPVTEWPER